MAWPHTPEERDVHLRGYEQELLAAENRLAELEALGAGDGPAADEARLRIENAKRLLKQLRPVKRPAGRAKETRGR